MEAVEEAAKDASRKASREASREAPIRRQDSGEERSFQVRRAGFRG
jgi:hypothetical protein